MRMLTIMAVGALALSGCTGTRIKPPAVCDGKHRRPANLYGTILPTLPVPLPASQGAGRSMVAPPSDGSAPAPLAPVPVPTPDEDPASASPEKGAMRTPASAPRTSVRPVALSYNC